MDSHNRGRALGHRKTIWIKRNPTEHHRSLGLLFAYSVTSEGAGLQSKTFGYKDRLWLQDPDLVLKLYHSFPLFPKPPLFK